MDIGSFLRDPLSRRRFFAGSGVGLAAGSAAALSACGSGKATGNAVKTTTESDGADVEILNGALDLELMGVAAYKIAAGQLRGDVLQIAKRILEQEQEHADALMSAIKDHGGTPNRAKSSYGFPALHSQRDALMFAVTFENTVVASYIDAMPKLTAPALRGTTSAIVTNEAEHISVLLGALGLPQIPHAFVTGQTA